MLDFLPVFILHHLSYFDQLGRVPDKPAAAGEGQSTAVPRVRAKKRPQKPEKPAPIVRKLEKRIKREPEATARVLPNEPDKGDDSTMRKTSLRRVPDRREKPVRQPEEVKPVIPPKPIDAPQRPVFRQSRVMPKPAPAPAVKPEPTKKTEPRPLVREKPSALPSSEPPPPVLVKPKPRPKRAPPPQPKFPVPKISPKMPLSSPESASILDTSVADLPNAVVDDLMPEILSIEEKDQSLSWPLQPEVNTLEVPPKAPTESVPSLQQEQQQVLSSQEEQDMSSVAGIPSNRSEGVAAQTMGADHIRTLDDVRASQPFADQSTVRRVSQDSNLIRQIHDGQPDATKPLDGTAVETMPRVLSQMATEKEEDEEHLEEPDLVDHIKPGELQETSRKQIDQDTKFQKQLHDETIVEPESVGLSPVRSLPGPVSEEAQKSTVPSPEMNPTIESSQPEVGREPDQAPVEGKVKQLQDEKIEQLSKQEPSLAKSMGPQASLSVVAKQETQDALKQPRTPQSPNKGQSSVERIADTGLSKQLLDANSDQTDGPEAQSTRSIKPPSESRIGVKSESLREEYRASQMEVRTSEIAAQQRVDADEQLKKQLHDEEQCERALTAELSVELLASTASDEAVGTVEKPQSGAELNVNEPTVGDSNLMLVTDHQDMMKPLQDAQSGLTSQSEQEAKSVESTSAMAIQSEVVPEVSETAIKHDEISVAGAPDRGLVSKDLPLVKQLQDASVHESGISAAPSARSMDLVSGTALELTEKPHTIGPSSGSEPPKLAVPVQDRLEKIGSEISLLPEGMIGQQISPGTMIREDNVAMQDIDSITRLPSPADAGSRLAQVTVEPAEQFCGSETQQDLAAALATSRTSDTTPLPSITKETSVTMAAESQPEKIEAAMDVTMTIAERKASRSMIMENPSEQITDKNLSQPKVPSQEVEQMPFLGTTLSEEATESTAASVGDEPTTHLNRVGEPREILSAPKSEKYDEKQSQVKLLQQEIIDGATMPEAASLPSAESAPSTAPFVDVETGGVLKSGTEEMLQIMEPGAEPYDTNQRRSREIHDEAVVLPISPTGVESVASEISSAITATEAQKQIDMSTENLTIPKSPEELGHISADHSLVKQTQDEEIGLITREKTSAETFEAVDSAVALAGGRAEPKRKTGADQKTLEKALSSPISSILPQDKTEIDRAQNGSQDYRIQTPLPGRRTTSVSLTTRHSSMTEIRELDKFPATVTTEPFRSAVNRVSVTANHSIHVRGGAIEMEDKVLTDQVYERVPLVERKSSEDGLQMQPLRIQAESGLNGPPMTKSTRLRIDESPKPVPHESSHIIELPTRNQGITSDTTRGTEQGPYGSSTGPTIGSESTRNISFRTLVSVMHRRSNTVGASLDQNEFRPHSLSLMSIHTKLNFSDDSRENADFHTQTIIRVSSLPGNLAQLSDQMKEIAELTEHSRTIPEKSCREMQINISQNIQLKVNGCESQLLRPETSRPHSSHGRRMVAANVAAVAPLSDSGQPVSLVSKAFCQLQSAAEHGLIKSDLQQQSFTSETGSSMNKTHLIANHIYVLDRPDPKIIGLCFINNPNGEPISTTAADSMEPNLVIALNDASVEDADKLLSQSAHSLVVTQEIAVANEYELELEDTELESPTTPHDQIMANIVNGPEFLDKSNETQPQHANLLVAVNRATDDEWQPARLSPEAVSVADTIIQHETPKLETQAPSLISLQVITAPDSSGKTKEVIQTEAIPRGSNVPATSTVGRPQFGEDSQNPVGFTDFIPNTTGSSEPDSPVPSAWTLLVEQNQDGETNGKSSFAHQSPWDASSTNQTTYPTESMMSPFGLTEPNDSPQIVPPVNGATNGMDSKAVVTPPTTTQWVDAEDQIPERTILSPKQTPNVDGFETTKSKISVRMKPSNTNEQLTTNKVTNPPPFSEKGISGCNLEQNIDAKTGTGPIADSQTESRHYTTANVYLDVTDSRSKKGSIEIHSRAAVLRNRSDNRQTSDGSQAQLQLTQKSRSPEFVEALNLAVSVMLADEGELELIARVNVCIDETETQLEEEEDHRSPLPGSSVEEEPNNRDWIRHPKCLPCSESMEDSTMPPKSATFNISTVTRVDLTVNGTSDACKKGDLINEDRNPKRDPVNPEASGNHPLEIKILMESIMNVPSPSSLSNIKDALPIQIPEQETAMDAEVFVQTTFSTSDNAQNSEFISFRREINPESNRTLEGVEKTAEEPAVHVKMLGDASLSIPNRNEIPEQENRSNMERDEPSLCCTCSTSETFSKSELESLHSSSICAAIIPRDKLIDLFVKSFPSKIRMGSDQPNLCPQSHAQCIAESARRTTLRIPNEMHVSRCCGIASYNQLLESWTTCESDEPITNSMTFAKSALACPLDTMIHPQMKVNLVSNQTNRCPDPHPRSSISEHQLNTPTIVQYQIYDKDLVISRSEIRLSSVQILDSFEDHFFHGFSVSGQSTQCVLITTDKTTQLRNTTTTTTTQPFLENQIVQQPLLEVILSSCQASEIWKEPKILLNSGVTTRALLRRSIKTLMIASLHFPSHLEAEQLMFTSLDREDCQALCTAVLNVQLLGEAYLIHRKITPFEEQFNLRYDQVFPYSKLLTNPEHFCPIKSTTDKFINKLKSKFVPVMSLDSDNYFDCCCSVYPSITGCRSAISWEHISEICSTPDIRSSESIVFRANNLCAVNWTPNESPDCHHYCMEFQGNIQSCQVVLSPPPSPPSVCSSSLTISSLLESNHFKDTLDVIGTKGFVSDPDKLEYDHFSSLGSAIRPTASPCMGDSDPMVDFPWPNECLVPARNKYNRIQENTVSSVLKEALVQSTPSVTSTCSLSKSFKNCSHITSVLGKPLKRRRTSYSESDRSICSENELLFVTENLKITKPVHSPTESQAHPKLVLTPTVARPDDPIMLISSRVAEPALDNTVTRNHTNYSFARTRQTDIVSQTVLNIPCKRRHSMEGHASPLLHYLAQTQGDPRVVHLTRSRCGSLNRSNSVSSLMSAVSTDLLIENAVSIRGNHDSQIDPPPVDRYVSQTPLVSCLVDQYSSLIASEQRSVNPNLLINSSGHFATHSCPIYTPDSTEMIDSKPNASFTDIICSDDVSLRNDQQSVASCSGRHNPTAEFTVTLFDPIEVDQNTALRDRFARHRSFCMVRPITKFYSQSDCVLPGIGFDYPLCNEALRRIDHQKYHPLTRNDRQIQKLKKCRLLLRQSTSEISDRLLTDHSGVLYGTDHYRIRLPPLFEPKLWNRIPLEFIRFPNITFLIGYQMRQLVNEWNPNQSACAIPTILSLAVVQFDLTTSVCFSTEFIQQHLGLSTEMHNHFQWANLYKHNLTRSGRPWHIYPVDMLSKRVKKIYLWSSSVCTNQCSINQSESIQFFSPLSVTFQISDLSSISDTTKTDLNHCPVRSFVEVDTSECYYSATSVTLTLVSLNVALMVPNASTCSFHGANESTFQLSENKLQMNIHVAYVAEKHNPCFPPNLAFHGYPGGQNLRLARYFRTTLENLANFPYALLDSTVQTIQPLLKVHAFTEVIPRPKNRHSYSSSGRKVVLVKQTVESLWIMAVIHVITQSFCERYSCELQIFSPEVQLVYVNNKDGYRVSHQMIDSSDLIPNSRLHTTPGRFVHSFDASCQIANWTEMDCSSSNGQLTGLDSATLSSSIQLRTTGFIVEVDELSLVQTNIVCTGQIFNSFTEREFSDQVQTELLSDAVQLRSADGKIYEDNEYKQSIPGNFLIRPQVQHTETIMNISHSACGTPYRPGSFIVLSTESREVHDIPPADTYLSLRRSSTSSKTSCDSKCYIRDHVKEDRRRRWDAPPNKSAFGIAVSQKDIGSSYNTGAFGSHIQIPKRNFILSTAGDAIEGFIRTEQVSKLSITKPKNPNHFVPVDRKLPNRIGNSTKLMNIEHGSKITDLIPSDLPKRGSVRPTSRIPVTQLSKNPPYSSVSPRQACQSARGHSLTARNDRGVKSTHDRLKSGKKSVINETNIPSKDQQIVAFKSRIPVRAKTLQKANTENVKTRVSSTKQVLYSTLHSQQILQ
ncbi:hypothetical protein FGIG_09842, partial [Fasciola gigantica]